jgi:hypothetical protein
MSGPSGVSAEEDHGRFSQAEGVELTAWKSDTPTGRTAREPRRFQFALTFCPSGSRYPSPAAGPPMRGYPARL